MVYDPSKKRATYFMDIVTAYVIGWLAFLVLIPTFKNLLSLDMPHAIVVAWVLSWLLFVVLVWY